MYKMFTALSGYFFPIRVAPEVSTRSSALNFNSNIAFGRPRAVLHSVTIV